MIRDHLGRIKQAARITWVALVAVFVASYIGRNWDVITDLTPRVGLLNGVAIVLVTVAGKMVVSEQLRLSAELLGARLTAVHAYRIYTSSDLAKYVPGGVWNAMARVKLLRDQGISTGSSGRAFALDKLWQVSGAFYSGLILCRSVIHEALLSRWIADSQLVTIVEQVAIGAGWISTTIVLNAVFAPGRQRLRALRRAIVDQAAIAVLLGLGLWIPLEALGQADVAIAIGAFALGRAAGYVAVFAPAGVGVREAVAVWVLSGTAETEVIVVALTANRVLTVLADVVSYGLALTLPRVLVEPNRRMQP